MEKIERILVVTRTTKYSQKAVDQGVLLTKNLGAKLTILHCIYNPFHMKGWNLPLPSLPALENEYKKMLEDAKSDLDQMVARGKNSGMAIEIIICTAEPNKEVFRIIHEKKIDLLILRAHTEGHIEHLLFGGSNEEIIRKMPCSIMMVKDEPKAVPYPND